MFGSCFSDWTAFSNNSVNRASPPTGLTATNWHDVNDPRFSWMKTLEKEASYSKTAMSALVSSVSLQPARSCQRVSEATHTRCMYTQRPFRAEERPAQNST